MKWWPFGRKKSREEARKRLQNLVGNRRQELRISEIVVTKEEFRRSSESLKRKIVSWAAEAFNVEKSKIRVELEERGDHVIIITNVSLR